MKREETIGDATLIAGSRSTKNNDGKLDPEMHQSKKVNDQRFGMKAHVGVGASSGLVHTAVTWQVVRTRSKQKALAKSKLGRMSKKLEHLKASVRTKVEDPFHVH